MEKFELMYDESMVVIIDGETKIMFSDEMLESGKKLHLTTK